MQMRKFLYETLDRRARACSLRFESLELGRRGFPTLAEVARQEADALDPPVREDGYRRVTLRRAPQRRA